MKLSLHMLPKNISYHKIANQRKLKRKLKRNWDRKDWWLSADECLDLQLVDQVHAMMPEMRLKTARAKAQGAKGKRGKNKKGKK